MDNTSKLKPNIVLSVKIRDIGNSPQNVGDLSLSNDTGGGQVESSNGGGGTRGIYNEEEGL